MIPAGFDGIEIEIPGGAGIYPPSEDTYLLLAMLKHFLESRRPGCMDPGLAALDMGSGAGLATLLLARHFMRVDAIDINPAAVAFVRAELSRRGRRGGDALVAGNLLDALRGAPGGGAYSLACFNPPYLPLEGYEVPRIQDCEDGREHAFFIDKALHAPGGGRAVLEQFLRDVRPHLVPGGHVFFVKSSLTGIDDTSAWASGFGFRIVERANVHRFFEDIEAFHAIA
ncbi:MAG: methyltransferase domain-containing protein [Candidatus Lokiarchaeota archaeon]|nr:methyltransferase domain-containing protein [Candidatus Lokiarchaeota archaeon]